MTEEKEQDTISEEDKKLSEKELQEKYFPNSSGMEVE
jgi:hypothetical protein